MSERKTACERDAEITVPLLRLPPGFLETEAIFTNPLRVQRDLLSPSGRRECSPGKRTPQI